MLFSFSVIRATSELGSSADRSNSVRVSGHEEEFVVKRKRGTVGGHLVGKLRIKYSIKIPIRET